MRDTNQFDTAAPRSSVSVFHKLRISCRIELSAETEWRVGQGLAWERTGVDQKAGKLLSKNFRRGMLQVEVSRGDDGEGEQISPASIVVADWHLA
jgi:hypothetical protein